MAEETLWVALQTLEERVQMHEALARDDRRRGWTLSAGGYKERASEAQAHADRLRTSIGTLTL